MTSSAVVARAVHSALYERFGPLREGMWEVILHATEHAMSEQLELPLHEPRHGFQL